MACILAAWSCIGSNPPGTAQALTRPVTLRDAQEIRGQALPRQDRQEGQGAQRPATPLVLDLLGDGILTTQLEDGGVAFDIDGDGELESTAWLFGSLDDVFLWHDLNGNKLVDGAAELFGSGTQTPWGQSIAAANGFDALALYDTAEFGGNADGQIDNKDRIWAHLSTWHDVNSDGVSQKGEISSAPAQRIARIDLAYTTSTWPDGSMNTIVAQGRFWVRVAGGGLQERTVADVAFRAQD